MEQIPEKFLNENGELNTSALVKSYCELEKKMSNMVTIPTSDSDENIKQKFNHAIGVPDNVEDYPKNSMFDDESVREKFHEIGLTSTQVEKIYAIAEEFLQPTLKNLFELQNQTNAINELKKFFGDEEKMNNALREINAFGERFLPHDAFDELCSTPQGIQGVYRMMQSMEPDVLTNKNESENLTDETLRNMMRDPKYWRDHDEEYIRKIENGFKKLYSK
ncbi:MAG: capsid assembly protein [Alphaproteobacteria bacterium]